MAQEKEQRRKKKLCTIEGKRKSNLTYFSDFDGLRREA
jgi:hypothetical protein